MPRLELTAAMIRRRLYPTNIKDIEQISRYFSLYMTPNQTTVIGCNFGAIGALELIGGYRSTIYPPHRKSTITFLIPAIGARQ
jgi:hypothetical protein